MSTYIGHDSSKLQLPLNKGGVALPKLIYYSCALHVRIIAE
uniref:Uncharacterized protein n=1 Tax=Anguilla anguilla TaxID=7936 RepID=A0A0E9SB36_ANGAN